MSNLSTSKRFRACDPCHSIKIKCEIGSQGGDPPCARCIRLGKGCIVTPPKRQKDRVAELEAQVELLSRLLQSQKLGAPVAIDAEEGGSLPSPDSTTVDSKKRRLNDTDARETPFVKEANDLDRIVSPLLQRTIYHRYVEEILPRFSLVSLSQSHNYESLRRNEPLLLLAVIYAACLGLLSAGVQDQVGRMLTEGLMAAVKSEAKSIGLVSAIQLTSLWYRFPRYHSSMTPQLLAQLAVDVAIDIGIAGSDRSPKPGQPPTDVQADSTDARRTWLVSYLGSTFYSVILRTRLANPVRWGFYEDTALLVLDYSTEDSRNNRLFTLYVRAERLCEEIVTQSGFLDSSTTMDLAEPRLLTNRHRNLITDWKAQIPPHLFNPILQFWEHVAVLYAHEYVLHTTTNKLSFAAPFACERLSVTDIPAPTVSPEHIDSLFALRDNAQAILEQFSTFDIGNVMALPPIVLVSRVAYAQWILMKLYLATTALGNTFGSFLDPESLKVDECLEKMISVNEKAQKIDPHCGNARILVAQRRLREWLFTYRASHQHSTTNINGLAPLAFTDFEVDWSNFTVAGDAFDAELNASNVFLPDPFPDLNFPISPS